MQWPVVNTLFQEKTKHHNRKDGSKETPKLGPCWKLQPVISTVNTNSWVRISHGSNKFVMNLNNNETEIPEDQLEEYALKPNAKDFACRSKAKAKPQRREPAGSSPRIVPFGRRNWIDVEPGKKFFSEYEVSMKVTFLLRHSQQMHRKKNGAVHFWRMKENLLSQFHQSIHGSDTRWKACLAARGGVKRRFQYCTGDSGTIVRYRALQRHSGRNLIDPSLQDNVVIPYNFFQHVYHIGCAFNLHSIIDSGLIPGGQSSSKRHTVLFLPVDPMDKSRKDPNVIDLYVPRHVQYLHNAWKRHQDVVNWVDINLAIEKGLTFYQARSNAIILQETLPAYCILKVVRMKIGEVLHEKVFITSASAKYLIETLMEKRIKFRTRPTLNLIRERLGRPDITHDVISVQEKRPVLSRFMLISFREEPSSSERTGRPVITRRY